MTRVLHLTSGSPFGCAAEPLSILAARLSNEAVSQSVFVLDSRRDAPGGPIPSGVTVRPFRVRTGFDPPGWRRVRQAVSELRPHILHAWGARAARFAWALTRRRVGLSPLPAVVVSSCVDHSEPGVRGWLTQRAIQDANRVLAFGPAEAAGYRAAGVTFGQLVEVPLGVLPIGTDGDNRTSLGLPPGVPYLAVAGRFDGASELKEAVWAFDVVRYADPAIHLVLVGDGPDLARVERFARAIMGADNRVAFAGSRPDVSAIFAEAAAVWVPASLGVTAVALAALSAGAPVVGFRVPDLEAVIDDGETGFLVPPGDRVALAGRTLELLNDPALRDRVVRAALAACRTKFPPEPVAMAVEAAYHALSTPIP